MEKLTAKERITRILKHLPVDRIGIYEEFWEDTRNKWSGQGHIKKDESLWSQSVWDHFGLDIRDTIPFNLTADIDFKEEIVEETEETKLVRDGNGALLRWHKLHDSTPEHVDFVIKDRKSWDTKAKLHLLNDSNFSKRIDYNQYHTQMEKCTKNNLFLALKVPGIFAQMSKLCGHEALLMGMALDPDWVKDMCKVYTELNINLVEILLEKEGKPDPAHKRLFDYAHSKGLPVFVHSCGFIESFVPGLIEAGMDCLQAMEVKAGMDLVKLKKAYGDKIMLMGGIDARTLISNDFDIIRTELENKVPIAMQGGGYCLHSDHSIPDQVNYKTYKFFLETGIKMGTYDGRNL
jgi:uroporphyrinogen decarboxylase